MKGCSTLIVIFIFLLINVTCCKAENLNYDDVLQKSVNNSFDLKISKTDIGIGKASIKEAMSDYFPAIKAGYYSEYNRDLTSGVPTYTSIGI